MTVLPTSPTKPPPMPAPPLRLRLFGAPEIRLDETVVTGLSVKAQALLFYLAITQKTHLRTTIASLLWDEMSERNAFANLRKVVQEFRAVLPDYVEIKRPSIALRQDIECWVDVVAFEELLGQAEQVDDSAAASHERAQALYLEAEELYQGDFLTGFFVRSAPNFETWQLTQQARLREMVIDLMNALSHQRISQHDIEGAIDATRRMIELEPWRESAHRQLMQLLVSSGRRHAALVQYEVCRHALEQELGVPPSDETIRLYQQIRDGEYDEVIGWWEQEAKSTGTSNAPPSTNHPITPSPPASSPLAPSPRAPSLSHLFGIEAAHNELRDHLQAMDRPWLLAIDGIGGIGKTTLAQAVTETVTTAGHFAKIAWVSAKQEELQPGLGIEKMREVAMDRDAFIDALLEQLTETGLAATPREKELQLMGLLKETPTLVVVDNLETVADYEALVPTLRDLANPSKFLITSRHALKRYDDIFCLTLGELDQQDAHALLRHEAQMRGLRGLSSASDDELAAITNVVGGHPLALNLVIGQLSVLPLAQVLANLKEATGQQVDEFYTYIYWQAWQMLDTPTRQLFLAMPMLFNATYSRISAVSQLSSDDLQSALAQLIRLSLVQVSGDLLEPRYRLHRLTETFLMNEVIKWNQESEGERRP